MRACLLQRVVVRHTEYTRTVSIISNTINPHHNNNNNRQQQQSTTTVRRRTYLLPPIKGPLAFIPQSLPTLHRSRYFLHLQLDRQSNILDRITSYRNRHPFKNHPVGASQYTTVAASRRIRGAQGRWGIRKGKSCTGDESLDANRIHFISRQHSNLTISYCFAFLLDKHIHVGNTQVRSLTTSSHLLPLRHPRKQTRQRKFDPFKASATPISSFYCTTLDKETTGVKLLVAFAQRLHGCDILPV